MNCIKKIRKAFRDEISTYRKMLHPLWEDFGCLLTNGKNCVGPWLFSSFFILLPSKELKQSLEFMIIFRGFQESIKKSAALSGCPLFVSLKWGDLNIFLTVAMTTSKSFGSKMKCFLCFGMGEIKKPFHFHCQIIEAETFEVEKAIWELTKTQFPVAGLPKNAFY